MKTNASFVKRHSLVLFFVLAYTLSWGNVVLAMTLPNVPFLFPYGPLLAALIMAGLTGGVKDLLSRCLRWRVGLQWYAAALLVGPAIGLVAVYLNVLLGAPAPTAALLGPWYGLFLLFPGAVVDAPLGEEPGWRGFALPRFSAERSPLANTLILGVLVVGWHAPLVVFEPALVAAAYLVGALASAVVTNWVYYNTRGSALLVMLYHSAANTVGIFFRPMLSGPDLVRYQWLLAGVTWAAAVVVVLATGPTLQRRPTALPAETAYIEQTPTSA